MPAASLAIKQAAVAGRDILARNWIQDLHHHPCMLPRVSVLLSAVIPILKLNSLHRARTARTTLHIEGATSLGFRIRLRVELATVTFMILGTISQNPRARRSAKLIAKARYERVHMVIGVNPQLSYLFQLMS